MTGMAHEPTLLFRIVVERPPPDVTFAVQLGRTELLAPIRTGPELVFEFQLRVKRAPTGQLVFLGPAAQGPPHDRFVYVNSGTSAGQMGSPWSRRAKLKLGTIDRELAEQVLGEKGLCLEGRVPAMGGDGGPVCATTKLFSGWQARER
jgi:hypothetical protein